MGWIRYTGGDLELIRLAMDVEVCGGAGVYIIQEAMNYRARQQDRLERAQRQHEARRKTLTEHALRAMVEGRW